jgi:hypothetical protein
VPVNMRLKWETVIVTQRVFEETECLSATLCTVILFTCDKEHEKCLVSALFNCKVMTVVVQGHFCLRFICGADF